MIVPLLAIIAFHRELAYATPGATLVQPHDGLITPGPELEVRDLVAYTDPRFVGWDIENGTVVQRTCVTGLTYSVRGTNWRCCPTSTTTCSFVDECFGRYTAVFPGGTSSQCATVCVTGTLYWSTADTSPYTYIGCGNFDYWVVQSSDASGLLSWNPSGANVAPKTTTAVTSTPENLPTTNPPTTTPPTTTPPTTTPPTVSPTPTTVTTSPVSIPTSKSNNSAMIGGAVGGGAVGIGLIVLGILLFLRRRRNNAALPVAPVITQHDQYKNQPSAPDMGPITYEVPGSSPPPIRGYKQNQNDHQHQKPSFFPTGNPTERTHQYAPLPNEDTPVTNVQPAEVSGVPVEHAMELPGSPIHNNKP